MRNLASCGILTTLLVGCQKAPEAVKPVPVASHPPVAQLDPRRQVFTPPIHEPVPIQRTTAPQQAPPAYKQLVGSWQRKDDPRERVSIEDDGTITLTAETGQSVTLSLEFSGTLSQDPGKSTADLRLTQRSETALEGAITGATFDQNVYTIQKTRPGNAAAIQRVRRFASQAQHIELSVDSNNGDLVILGDEDAHRYTRI